MIPEDTLRPAPMLAHFLETLHDSGRAELAPMMPDLLAALRGAGKTAGEERKVARRLEAWHAEAVMELPGPPLGFHPEAAMWGAVLLFRATCLTSFRGIGEKEVHELLEHEPMPDAAHPAAHFSADLCLRHWPDLYRMARACSEDDPLVKIMSGLALSFPLSSLGMNLAVSQQGPIFGHAGLRQLFIERALERADHSCLAVPEIAALVRSKLGSHSAIRDRGLLPPLPES